MTKPKRYKFSYDELNISKDEFIQEFVKTLVETYKIPQKTLDSIYTDLVNKWNSPDK